MLNGRVKPLPPHPMALHDLHYQVWIDVEFEELEGDE